MKQANDSKNDLQGSVPVERGAGLSAFLKSHPEPQSQNPIEPALMPVGFGDVSAAMSETERTDDDIDADEEIRIPLKSLKLNGVVYHYADEDGKDEIEVFHSISSSFIDHVSFAGPDRNFEDFRPYLWECRDIAGGIYVFFQLYEQVLQQAEEIGKFEASANFGECLVESLPVWLERYEVLHAELLEDKREADLVRELEAEWEEARDREWERSKGEPYDPWVVPYF